MRRAKLNFGKFHGINLPALVVGTILLTGCFPARSLAQQREQKIFPSPEVASDALLAATQSNDEKVLLEILGPDAKQIVSSGDDAEDALNRANFVEKFREMHRLVKEPDGTVTLYIGAHNWPTPIPIVSNGNSWYFNTDAAKSEILARRIGRNEMSAIRVCQELVAAQKEYRSSQKSEYAAKIFSDKGQNNGLYWEVPEGGPQSPIGPLVAWAVAEENARSRGEAPVPFRGYYFEILTRQGKNAPGGAKSYITSGKMSGGFAFVAYPAEYRSSGVMTFIVGEDGIVFENDLGKKSESLAKSMREFNPTPAWQKADLVHEEVAAEQKSN
ncbi:MAG TPA: DUF2950 domain-containing protein [Candidatus Acidoferrum sp.]|jgi:hypothetical protein|nr:DUF2950 domain-containing protein [Candidatus Acidoferrum sp.]